MCIICLHYEVKIDQRDWFNVLSSGYHLLIACITDTSNCKTCFVSLAEVFLQTAIQLGSKRKRYLQMEPPEYQSNAVPLNSIDIVPVPEVAC